MESRSDWLACFLSTLESEQRYQFALTHATQTYYLKPYNIIHLTPAKIHTLYQYLDSKFYQSWEGNWSDSWVENQLRIYIWLLCCYSWYHQRPIHDLTDEDWLKFAELFKNKKPIVLEYQSRFLLKGAQKVKKWNQEESQLLIKVMSQKDIKNKWNDIAKKLYVDSDKRYFRTPKQCREQWINHLDPTKKRTSWSTTEDFQLVQSVMRNGKKWSKVSKDLDQKRTEHMVKNRFKSLLNTEMKRLCVQDDEDLLIKKMLQRLQSCQALKQLQQSRKEKKKQNKNVQKIVKSQELQENQLVIPGRVKIQEGCDINENVELKNLQIAVGHQKEKFNQHEYIDSFFQDPTFINFPTFQ